MTINAQPTLNIVGEFNVAGDLWGIKPLIEKMGVKIVSVLTGDSSVEDIATGPLCGFKYSAMSKII